MSAHNFGDALEADALVAAQEACDRARREFGEQQAVRARACVWKLVDPLSGRQLDLPARMYLEFPNADGRITPTSRAAIRELRHTLRGMEAVAALLVTVVPDTEKPEYKVAIQLETPRHRRRVWMASIRRGENILGDFEEVNVDSAFFLLPQAPLDEIALDTTGIHRRASAER